MVSDAPFPASPSSAISASSDSISTSNLNSSEIASRPDIRNTAKALSGWLSILISKR